MLPKYILAISTIFELLKIKMTRYFPITLLLIFFGTCLYAQQVQDSLKPFKPDTSVKAIPDTSGFNKKPPKVVHHKIRPDTALIALTDTSRLHVDSLNAVIQPVVKSYYSVVDSLLLAGKFINVKEPATYFVAEKKQSTGEE